MKSINHLVLAANDLDALSARWTGLGFTLTPRGQHPFGTGNAIIQLNGSYLELLSVTIPQDVVEHRPGEYSFSAFNRDYLARHDGFSMMVVGTSDAAADIVRWREAGLATYKPFEFSRTATMPDGEEVRVGFSLAFVSNPYAPWLGHFACQHYRPGYYEQPRYLRHDNSARSVSEVWISGDGALGLADHFSVVLGGQASWPEPARAIFETPAGDIVLASPEAFEEAFGTPPPHMEDGPHLAGLTIACSTIDHLADRGLDQVGGRLILGPARGFGTVVAFTA